MAIPLAGSAVLGKERRRTFSLVPVISGCTFNKGGRHAPFVRSTGAAGDCDGDLNVQPLIPNKRGYRGPGGMIRMRLGKSCTSCTEGGPSSMKAETSAARHWFSA